MTPFERSKVQENFYELLRGVQMAERRALNSLDRELEKRNNSDMIAELNSCLGVS